MQSLLLIPLLAAACLAAPTVNPAGDDIINSRNVMFTCLPSADLRILTEVTQPVYICRAGGRVLALAFDAYVPKDERELHVVLEPETVTKLGQAFVAREKRTLLGSGAGSGSTASATSLGFGIGNPFAALTGRPLISGGLSTSHAHSGAIGTGGLIG